MKSKIAKVVAAVWDRRNRPPGLLRPVGAHRAPLQWLLVLALLAPAKLFACATCFGGSIDSPMTSGMNWAIFTLGVVITTVLGGFLAFLIYAIRKSEAVEAARVAHKNSTP